MAKKEMVKIVTTLNIVQVYVLLNENYVEDDDNMFRFDYRWIESYQKCSCELFVWL